MIFLRTGSQRSLQKVSAKCGHTKVLPPSYMLSDDRMSHKFYTGLEIKALQRKVRPRRYSVDRQDEDRLTSRLSSHGLFGKQSLALTISFARDGKRLPILLRSLEFKAYRSVVSLGHIDPPLTGTTENKAKRPKAIGGYLRSTKCASS
jgi:hypothetical protein